MSMTSKLVIQSTQSITGKMKITKGGILVDGQTFIPMNVVQAVINNTVFYTKGSVIGTIESAEEKNGFIVYHVAGAVPATVTVMDSDCAHVIMTKEEAVEEEEDDEEVESETDDDEDEEESEEDSDDEEESEDDEDSDDEEESDDDDEEEEDDESDDSDDDDDEDDSDDEEESDDDDDEDEDEDEDDEDPDFDL